VGRIRAINEAREIPLAAAGIDKHVGRHLRALNSARNKSVIVSGKSMEAQREAGMMAKGAVAVPGVKGFRSGGTADDPRLEQAGTNKHLGREDVNQAIAQLC
jgi:hypothetical protein